MKEREEKRLKEKYEDDLREDGRRQKEKEEQRAREREVAGRWMLDASDQDKEPKASSATSRSRLRIRALLEKQAKQRVCQTKLMLGIWYLEFGIW